MDNFRQANNLLVHRLRRHVLIQKPQRQLATLTRKPYPLQISLHSSRIATAEKTRRNGLISSQHRRLLLHTLILNRALLTFFLLLS